MPGFITRLKLMNRPTPHVVDEEKPILILATRQFSDSGDCTEGQKILLFPLNIDNTKWVPQEVVKEEKENTDITDTT